MLQAFNPVAGLESIVRGSIAATSKGSSDGNASAGGTTSPDQGHGGQVRRAIADIIPG